MKQFNIKLGIIIWTYHNEFSELRALTKDYTIPDDVCGTFTKTYQLLKQFDELSQE